MPNRRNEENIPVAKKLRRNQTNSEKLLWSYLRNRNIDGVKFRRQYPIGVYVLDFVSIEKKLVVEIDGGQHNEQDHKEYDDIRSSWLQQEGFRVLRFWNNEILENSEGVVFKIREELGKPSSLPSPLKREKE